MILPAIFFSSSVKNVRCPSFFGVARAPLRRISSFRDHCLSSDVHLCKCDNQFCMRRKRMQPFRQRTLLETGLSLRLPYARNRVVWPLDILGIDFILDYHRAWYLADVPEQPDKECTPRAKPKRTWQDHYISVRMMIVPASILTAQRLARKKTRDTRPSIFNHGVWSYHKIHVAHRAQHEGARTARTSSMDERICLLINVMAQFDRKYGDRAATDCAAYDKQPQSGVFHYKNRQQKKTAGLRDHMTHTHMTHTWHTHDTHMTHTHTHYCNGRMYSFEPFLPSFDE